MSTAHTEIAVADLRATLGDTIARTAYTGERVIITRHGKPAAALVSADDLAYFEQLEDEADADALREAIANDNGERHKWEDVKSELGLDGD
ncbi:type II toxin-antitoxin system Phd/YefM family antitoxin [Gordonia effusa]|nr:type II toxin-antitoxin system Phd/YefM family antitoxin [Gordonia effusa]